MQQSGEKTEKATDKKRKDQREKGNILKTHDFSVAIVLLILFYSLKILGGYIGEKTIKIFRDSFYNDAIINGETLSMPTLNNTFLSAVLSGLAILLPVFGILVVFTIGIQLAQTRFLFTTKTLAFKFDRISLFNGLKRMFSFKSVAEMIKSLLKIGIVIATVYPDIMKYIKESPFLLNISIVQATSMIFGNALSMAIKAIMVLIIISVLDIFYQWWNFEKELKMTKQEVKEETKLSEGNPQTKGRIQQKQRQMSAMRMMSEVIKADVIVTNPTHFAVALRYRSKIDNAPIVLAKGQDFLAQRIKEKAKENNIVIVENRPLARTLYAKGEIGKPISADLFQAVAEILAYVAKIKSLKF